MSDSGNDAEIDEASLPVTTWLDRLSGPHGSPGGGAACAVMVAVSAALLAMVAGYHTDDDRVAQARDRLLEVRRRALDAAAADSRRSGQLGAALRDEDAEADPVPDAALAAATSAVALGELAASLVPEMQLLLDVAAAYLVPDLVVAAEAAVAAMGGTAATVRADLRLAERHGIDPAASAVHAATAGVERMDAARARMDALRAAAAERI